MKQHLRRIKHSLRKLFYSKEERRHSLVGPAFLWKQKREFQITFLKDNGLQPEHFLLDLGCGTLRGGIPIIDYLQPGHYYGIDVRENVLREARKELKENGLQFKKPILIKIDRLKSLSLGLKFDIIWAFSVLFHMDDNTLDECFGFVKKHLKSNGVFFSNVSLGNEYGKWEEFPFIKRNLELYEILAKNHYLNMTVLGTLSELGHILGEPSHDNQVMLKFTHSKKDGKTNNGKNIG